MSNPYRCVYNLNIPSNFILYRYLELHVVLLGFEDAIMQVKSTSTHQLCFIPFAGRFGNGVLSFFVFLKWLLFLNLVIFILEFGLISLPSVIIKANITSQANTNSCNFDEFRIGSSSRSTADQVIDFVTGQVSYESVSFIFWKWSLLY